MTKLLINDKVFWGKVYDILISDCGASEGGKFSFMETNGDFTEWRFGGVLGFGGKVWNNNNEIYVNCYSEDMNNNRMEIICNVNKRLNDFLLGYFNE